MTEYEQRIQNCGYDLIHRANIVHFLLSSAEGLHDTPEWASLLDDCARSIESAENFPAVDAVPIVRCAECKYAPSGTGGLDLEWPYRNEDGFDTNPCPLKCSDPWYSKKPKPDFFCAYGERRTEE